MKILKLLSKRGFSIILISFISFTANAEDKPVDIWNIDQNKIEQELISEEIIAEDDKEIEKNSASDIYNMQSGKKDSSIELEETLKTKEIKIYGLYDPEDYDLDINLWKNSNGDQLKNIISRLNKVSLSEDATEIIFASSTKIKSSANLWAILPDPRIPQLIFFTFCISI